MMPIHIKGNYDYDNNICLQISVQNISGVEVLEKSLNIVTPFLTAIHSLSR